MQEYNSLAEIAGKDFLEVILENNGLTAEELAELGSEMEQKAKKLAAMDKKQAVLKYLCTEKGINELQSATNSLMSKYELAKDHFRACLLAAKVKDEAADELIKHDSMYAKFAAFEFIIKPSTIHKYDDIFIVGCKLVMAAEEEIIKLKDSGDSLDKLVDILVEQPDWLDKLIKNLELADNCFHQSIPGGKFPSSEQIREGAKIIFGKEWTPKHSMRYWLEAVQKTM